MKADKSKQALEKLAVIWGCHPSEVQFIKEMMEVYDARETQPVDYGEIAEVLQIEAKGHKADE